MRARSNNVNGSRSRARILFCEANMDGTVGGSYYSLLFLTRAIDRSRYEAIVVFYQDNPLIARFEEAGVRVLVMKPAPAVHLFPNHPWLARRFRWLQKGLNFLRCSVFTAFRNARLLRRERVRLVHLNNSVQLNYDWMIAAAVARIPCVTHQRGFEPHYGFRARLLSRGFDAVICISQAVRQSVVEGGVDGSRVLVVYNGLDPRSVRITQPPEDIRRALGIAPNRPLVGIVGNIKDWKGQDVVVRAVAELRERFPELACLLVGDTGDLDREFRAELDALIDRLGVRDRVYFTGFKMNVADYYNAMDVVIHASSEPEPFGRVLLEAMALRRPLIGSHAGAVPEIVADGETGLTFPPGDHHALAVAIARLLEDREYARRLAENGYARLVRDFHIDRNIAATEALYERLLDGPRPAAWRWRLSERGS